MFSTEKAPRGTIFRFTRKLEKNYSFCSMKVTRSALVVLIALFVQHAFAQNEITLINGLSYKFEKITVDSNWVKFDFKTKSGKLKNRILDTEDIFSIKKNNQESVVYRSHANPEDTAEMLSIPEMRLYVLGQHEGRESYNGVKHFILGAAAGFAPAAASNSVLVSLLAPPAYTLVSSIFPVHRKNFSQFDLEAPVIQQYGRKKQFRKMRTATSIKSSFIGAVVGFLVSDYITYH